MNESLGSVYILLGDGAKHCFELSDQIQRSERPVPNRCLELISLRVTLPRLEQMAE
jgi:hypothetical protein